MGNTSLNPDSDFIDNLSNINVSIIQFENDFEKCAMTCEGTQEIRLFNQGWTEALPKMIELMDLQGLENKLVEGMIVSAVEEDVDGIYDYGDAIGKTGLGEAAFFAGESDEVSEYDRSVFAIASMSEASIHASGPVEYDPQANTILHDGETYSNPFDLFGVVQEDNSVVIGIPLEALK